MKKVEGYKTYILVGFLMLTGVLHSQGYIAGELAITLYGVLGPLLGVTIRSGMKADNAKLEKKVEADNAKLAKSIEAKIDAQKEG